MPDTDSEESTTNQPEVLSREEANRILATSKAVREDKRKVEQEIKVLQEKLAAFGDITPEQLAAMQQAQKDAATKREAEIADFRALKASSEAERAKLLAEIEAAKTAQAETTLRYQAESEFVAAGGATDKTALGSSFDLLWPKIQSRLAIVDGTLQVVAPDGYPDPKYESPAGLFAELAKDPLLATFFKPRGTTGSGARGTKAASRDQRQEIRKLHGSDRIEAAHKLNAGG